MKISAIKRVITRGREIVIYEDDEGQWIGTKDACYKVDGVMIDEKSIGGLLDISEGKLTEMTVHTELMCVSALRPVEDFPNLGIRQMMPVVWDKTYIPIRVEDELYLLDAEKLKAAKVGRDEPYLMMRRNAQGDPLVLVGDGMRVNGIIRPENMQAVEVVLDMARELMHLRIGPVYKDGKAQITVSEVMEDAEDEEMDADGV